MAFNCQRCKQPLRIDDTLTDLDTAATELLVAPLSAEEQYQQHLRQSKARYSDTVEPVSRRLVGIKGNVNSPAHKKQQQRDSFPLPSESFVVLTRSQLGGQTPASATTSSSPTTAAVGVGTSSSSSPASQQHHQQHQQQHLQHVRSPSSSSTSAAAAADDNNGSRNNSLSHRLRVASRLFNVMSSRSSVDHPMCQECTDMLLESLEKQLEDVGLERDCYIEYLEKVKEGRITDDELKDLEQQVKELKLAEDEALSDLTKAREEHEAVNKEMEELEVEMKALEEREQKFWEQYNDYELKLENFQSERASINLKYDHDVKQFERLQKTVVYNDAFCISQEGPFGTINGFRLGRLSSQPVEWSEINAAWGQTLLLLYTVANKLKFQFHTYRLVPMGSFSRVEKVDGDTVLSYELYGSNEFGLNRMFLNRRLDHAMVAILNCLQQLTDFAEERDRSLRFPYRIHKDKIGDVSIRVQFNQDELWTKALKYMLTNMKWILVFASRTSVAAVPP
ncbi:autophagy protein Apg6-domain-containing protein [Zychaea mexicana]|uniref:autophagy protein Apg6-domain-containing protein n=1 Tax=Zychaea mexicana TaxID=64656 RepID=UPI0022FDBA5A|nr:autophagy protein Apg6-domain-containing protein [Zychaea mexicana]KAI9496090.1 autophagy protein Apg6-domain-containing protein [Zychaea mexicana]